MQASGDHQMDHQPPVAFEADRDALADALERHDAPTVKRIDRRVEGPQQERVSDARRLQARSEQALLQRLEIDRDIRQLGHAPCPPRAGR